MLTSLGSARTRTLVLSGFAAIVLLAAGGGALAGATDPAETTTASIIDGKVAFQVPPGWQSTTCMDDRTCAHLSPEGSTNPEYGVTVTLMPVDPDAPEGDPSMMLFVLPELPDHGDDGVERRTVDGYQAVRAVVPDGGPVPGSTMLMVLLDKAGTRVFVMCEGEGLDRECDQVMRSLTITWP
ncbi:hypothetical protein [Catellatospora tritici]|uniref:hypothetical protein n=1 Tax=Catellatospora tritici TaxID=2851566 RepID=UPI001C2D187B|nr:hypothetical protein [Catellatospora tritici]MBV1856596.1 hypothetical protein [Catellatospora tritici]